MVTNELRGEKVDIVPFSEDPTEFVQRALQPAKVKEVRLDDETGTATVVVHDYQLSLAIGKEGQNARLAARLTGWRIDIKSETQMAEEAAGYSGEEWAEGEWVENAAGEMVWQPAEGGEAVSAEQWASGGAEPSKPAEGAAEAEPTGTAESAEPTGTAEPPEPAEPAASAEPAEESAPPEASQPAGEGSPAQTEAAAAGTETPA